MTSHPWQPILLCCPPPDLSAYGYWVRGAAADSIIPMVEPYYSGWLLPEKYAKWIIGEKDGHVFFGRRGQVGEVMGWDYPAATDNVGRRLEFFLGYSAPSGTPLPRASDFERIEATMKEDIDKFYAELSKAYPSRNIVSVPTSFDFSKTQGETASDHAWDKLASAIEGGKTSTLLVINQEGDIQTQDLARKPPKNDDRSRFSNCEQKKTEESELGSDRKSSPSSNGQSAGYAETAHTPSRSDAARAFDSGQAAILVSLCTICVGGIAALLYKSRQKKDRQKEQTEAPKAQLLALLSGQKGDGTHPRR